MPQNRVRFFGRNNILYGMGMDKIETIIIPEFKDVTINDAIEFFNIKQYFDDGARAKDWTDEQYAAYKKKSEELYRLSQRFFNGLNDDNIIEQHKAAEAHYESDFWALFDSCKLYNTISDSIFEQLIQNELVTPEDLFRYKATVKRYDALLRDYLLNSGFGVRILIQVYEQDYKDLGDTKQNKLYLPDSLTDDDVRGLLNMYLDSDNPSPNELESIFWMRAKTHFPIDDDMRFKAKNRHREEMKKRFSSNSTPIYFGYEISIAKDQTEVVKSRIEGRVNHISYSEDWLLFSLDFPSILNNFLYVFGFVDVLEMRCQLVSKNSNVGLYERIFRTGKPFLYPDDMLFRCVNGLALDQIKQYTLFLAENGILFEDVLKWFFTVYLQEEFNCAEIRVSFPSKNTTPEEKCTLLCRMLDSLLKQYRMFVQEKTINFSKLEMQSSSVKLKDIPSLVEKKYIYGTGDIYGMLSKEMFSDQSFLPYVERLVRIKKEYNSFYDLLLNEEVFLTDYYETEIIKIKKLSEYGIISISEDGQIKLSDHIKLTILSDLFKNDVISRQHYPTKAQFVIDDWIEEGILREGSSLLSEQEISYFNYLLNKADEVVNGLDLRNKYIHGIMQMNKDDAIHEKNYYYFLIIFTILAIKINDDFCLYEKQRKEQDA